MSAPHWGDPVAELHGVTKVYYKPDGSVLVEALRGVDLTIPQGQYTAIMGASGSGKSTLMNVLGCLDRPTSGEYILQGQPVSELTDESLSHTRGRKIGFIFQAFNLISQLTVEENVETPLLYQGVGQGPRRKRAIEALELVGLGDRLGHRPNQLSGGQQQRAAIARALATEPVILMADEPTGNLDTATGEAILKLFDELHAKGMTIIMVTHDDEVAERCERVIRMRDGLIETDVIYRHRRMAPAD
ncbi:MAG: ABC transporter ATP-binding protein [Phycisphaeraceae bacterium]|nr:ABC transporter ATP-binding protein [Phycisphaeraceae bacterium]MCB9848031.1 ABC transporter ATP-binding protein [Phycisphaeraceae bacterium]